MVVRVALTLHDYKRSVKQKHTTKQTALALDPYTR
jgi:hypothetical protein